MLPRIVYVMRIKNRNAITRTAITVILLAILLVAIGTTYYFTRMSSPGTGTASKKLALVLGGDETDVGLNANGVEVAKWIQSTYGWNV
jgi:hypothetical protein